MSLLHDLLVTIRTEHADLRNANHTMPKKFQFGICMAFDRTAVDAGITGKVLEDLEAKLAALFLKWPEYSGNEKYPVPSPLGLGTGKASLAYSSYHYLLRWDPSHPYGAARLRLLDWLIEATKED